MAETENKVVVGERKSRLRSILKNKKTWIIVAIVLVLGAFGTVATVISLKNHKATQTRVVAEAKLPGESLEDKVNTGLANSRYDETLAMLAAQKPNDSHEVLGYEALVYMSQPNYPKALELWDEIESRYGMNRSEAAAAAYAAEETNQVNRAIGYYEKAIAVAKKNINKGLNQVDAESYQKNIDRLKAK